MEGLPAKLGMLIPAGSVWSRGTAADEAAAPACVSGTRASCRQIPPALHSPFPFSCSAGREFMRSGGCAWWRHAQNVWNNKALTSTRGTERHSFCREALDAAPSSGSGIPAQTSVGSPGCLGNTGNTGIKITSENISLFLCIDLFCDCHSKYQIINSCCQMGVSQLY